MRYPRQSEKRGIDNRQKSLTRDPGQARCNLAGFFTHPAGYLPAADAAGWAARPKLNRLRSELWRRYISQVRITA